MYSYRCGTYSILRELNVEWSHWKVHNDVTRTSDLCWGFFSVSSRLFQRRILSSLFRFLLGRSLGRSCHRSELDFKVVP